MNLKFCIAKMVGTAPVYQTDTVNTWVSDITDSTVKWYPSEGAAREDLGGPETFVVPLQYVDLMEQAKALERACEAVSEAVEIGAIVDIGNIPFFVSPDALRKTGAAVEKEEHGEIFSYRYSRVCGVLVCAQVKEEPV